MDKIIGFLALQQFIYGIGWLVGIRLIPEIRRVGIWLSGFAILSGLYFSISPTHGETVTSWHIYSAQFVILLVMVMVRRANEALFFEPYRWKEDASLIVLFLMIVLWTFSVPMQTSVVVMTASFIVLWMGIRTVVLSYRSISNEFGLTITLLVNMPIIFFLLVKGVQAFAIIDHQMIILDPNTGRLESKWYLALLLALTGLMHVNYVVMLLKRLIQDLNKMTKTDVLTNVMNRRAAEEALCRELSETTRNGDAFTIFMIDIDFFKSVNDRYGHAKGDEVLRGVCKCMRETVRKNDYVARFGGEEFLIILPHTLVEPAVELADRIRQKVADLRFEPNNIRVTISIGVTQSDTNDTVMEHIVSRADKALYRSKECGRNQINVNTKILNACSL